MKGLRPNATKALSNERTVQGRGEAPRNVVVKHKKYKNRFALAIIIGTSIY